MSGGTGFGWPRKRPRTNRYFLARFYARHPPGGFSNRVSRAKNAPVRHLMQALTSPSARACHNGLATSNVSSKMRHGGKCHVSATRDSPALLVGAAVHQHAGPGIVSIRLSEGSGATCSSVQLTGGPPRWTNPPGTPAVVVPAAGNPRAASTCHRLLRSGLYGVPEGPLRSNR